MFSLRQAADCLARTHLPDPIGLVLLKSFPQGEEYSVVISSAISGLPHPPLRFKNSSGSNRLLRFGQNKKQPVIYRPKCIRLPPIKVSQAETHNRAQEHGGMVHISVDVMGAGCDQLRSEADGRGDLLEMWFSSRRLCDNSAVTSEKLGGGT